MDFCYYYPGEEIHERGDGVMGIGESVVRQDSKIALCQTTVILILKEKHIWCKRKSLLQIWLDLFHWSTVVFKGNQNTFFFTAACELGPFSSQTWNFRFEKQIMARLSLKQGWHFRELPNNEPTEPPPYSSVIEIAWGTFLEMWHLIAKSISVQETGKKHTVWWRQCQCQK